MNLTVGSKIPLLEELGGVGGEGGGGGRGGWGGGAVFRKYKIKLGVKMEIWVSSFKV